MYPREWAWLYPVVQYAPVCLAAKERPIGAQSDLTASMATSMRRAEHENEGDNEELIALIVADAQDPVTPILKAALVGEGLHARVA